MTAGVWVDGERYPACTHDDCTDAARYVHFNTEGSTQIGWDDMVYCPEHCCDGCVVL